VLITSGGELKICLLFRETVGGIVAGLCACYGQASQRSGCGGKSFGNIVEEKFV
jgi:hypothetical protein